MRPGRGGRPPRSPPAGVCLSSTVWALVLVLVLVLELLLELELELELTLELLLELELGLELGLELALGLALVHTQPMNPLVAHSLHQEQAESP